MRQPNGVGAPQVRDGAGDLEDPVKAARRQVHLLHGRLEQRLRGIVHLAVVPHLHRAHLGVGYQGGVCEPPPLDLPRRLCSALDSGRGFGVSRHHQLFVLDPGHLDKQVNPVEQRAADALLVA